MKASFQDKQRRREVNRHIMGSFRKGFKQKGKKEPLPRIEKQELHCHRCDRYVQFEIDVNMDGRHVLNCPNCGHEHWRIVKNGIITSDRWGQDPSQDMGTIYIRGTVTSTVSSMYTSRYDYGTTASATNSSWYTTT